MAYSKDFKERAVAYKQEGHTFEQLREAFGIPSETYYQWEQNFENGYYDKVIKRERKRKMDKEALKQSVASGPDACLREWAGQFNCTPSAVFLALKKLGITRKKRPLHMAKSQQRAVGNI
jgi:transposase-like protein